MPNRLASERSPYLLQHAGNPVDWRPWGSEAFDLARRENKPIFLSIGYSTCHWCHVMAHESFEDPAIAAVLNREFVPIKLDREERPDVDRVYMTFVQATTGAGGWPMSVWLTPDLEPFFGGTYFPPGSRWGKPGFLDLLTQIAERWRSDRARVAEVGKDMVAKLREATGADAASPDRAPVAGREAIDAGVAAFRQAFDGRHGGFGGAPKFPRPSELRFLLDAYGLTGDHAARQMALDTLRAMALGGMRDHVGGGFHRYSVDAEWRVPHFEKMLYDQSQLVVAYLEATQASGDQVYAAVAEDTIAYVLRDLTAPDGAFFSAEDADSVSPPGVEVPGDRASGSLASAAHEKKEGAFYVWSAAEIDALFGADAPIIRRRFGIEDAGNAFADPQGEFTGQNILYVAQSIDEISARTGRSVDEVMATLARGRDVLLEARARRPRPHLDDKVITAWNGLMLGACARAARVLVDSPARDTYRAAAIRAATAVRDRLWQADRRRLLRRYRDGDSAIDAFCEDYAYLAWGLTELFQTTGDPQWMTWALDLVAVAAERFLDERDGGWFSTAGDDPSVLLRLKEDYDGAEPAAASVMVRTLLMLAKVTGDTGLRDRAGRALERYGPALGRVARVMPFMLSNVACWQAPPVEIVIAGAASPAAEALEREVAARFLPFAVVVRVTPEHRASLASLLPWLGALGTTAAPTAHVCREFACQLPVCEPAALAAQLATLGPSSIIV